jgi:hypothetical protein
MMMMDFSSPTLEKNLDDIQELLGVEKKAYKEQELNDLKKELKDWEKEFETQHGRKPTQSDIKKQNMGTLLSIKSS